MDRFDTARALVLAAGARLRLARPEAGAVWEKTGHQDLVTRCDRETEQFLRSGILSAFPASVSAFIFDSLDNFIIYDRQAEQPHKVFAVRHKKGVVLGENKTVYGFIHRFTHLHNLALGRRLDEVLHFQALYS